MSDFINELNLSGEAERLVANEKGGAGNEFLEKFVKMPEKEGAVVIRLLPPAANGKFGREKNPFFKATRVHKVGGKSLHCARQLIGKKWVGECPICKYYQHLWKESEKQTDSVEAKKLQQEARAIKPIERYYYNVIARQQTNRNGEVEKNVGPKILSVGVTLHKMIVTSITGNKDLDEPGLGNVTDFVNGRDFKIIKKIKQSGKDAFPDYATSKFLEPSPLGSGEEINRWVENMHDLESLRVVKSVEEMTHALKMHLGIIKEENNEFDAAAWQKAPAATVNEKAVEPKVAAEPKLSTPTGAAPVMPAISDEDVGMSDDDFVNDLKNL